MRMTRRGIASTQIAVRSSGGSCLKETKVGGAIVRHIAQYLAHGCRVVVENASRPFPRLSAERLGNCNPEA